MPDDRLSAREAALIAQARAELEKKSAVPAGAAPRAAAMEPTAPAATKPIAPGADAAERLALLLAAARAETGRQRRRQKILWVWVPVAFISAAGLWTLLWMWHRL